MYNSENLVVNINKMPKEKSKALRAWALTFQVCENALPNQLILPEPIYLERLFQDKLNAARYVFQYERGENSDKMHIQCHLELKEAVSGPTLREKIRFSAGIREWYHKGCLTTRPVSDLEASFQYAGKEDTRVRGPFKYPTSFYTGSDLLGSERYPNRFPWQQSIFEMIDQEPDDRSFHVIYEETGCRGKNKLVKTLGHTRVSIKVPVGQTPQQGIAAVISAPVKRVYIADFPRCSNINNPNIWEVLEDVKNGYLASPFRGKYADLYMDPPHVLVFANQIPDLDLLSFDRWNIWTVNANDELERLNKWAVRERQQQEKREKEQRIFNQQMRLKK